MQSKSGILYNRFFYIPFIIWVVVGGILILNFSERDIFHAVNTHYSDIGDTLMYHTTWMGEGMVIVTALLLLMAFRPFRNVWYFLLALCCNIIPFFIQQLLKSYFDSPRPHLVFYDRIWLHYAPDWPVLLHRSFPSGHSEGAFSFFCFLTLLLPPKYRKLGLLFFLLALSVCYSRLYLAAHFFEDVYVGSIIGVVTTTIIFTLMNKYKGRFFKEAE